MSEECALTMTKHFLGLSLRTSSCGDWRRRKRRMRMSLLCVQPAGCASAAIHREANLLLYFQQEKIASSVSIGLLLCDSLLAHLD